MTSADAPLTAAQATAQLGVKVSTLYAYVSRGLIRSLDGPPGTRERRYDASDVAALVGRQAARRDPDTAREVAVQGAVRGALSWGLPVLDTHLTRIGDNTLSYRGHDAVELAEWMTVEQVAALLWTGDREGWRRLPLRGRLLRQSVVPVGTGEGEWAAQAFGHALVMAGAHDLPLHDPSPARWPAQAARVLTLLYATLERVQGVPPAPDLPLHLRLARAWSTSGSIQPHVPELLRQALILLADHELNISTFAARVAAGGGANLPHVTLAALSALQGHKHGLASLGAADLLDSALRLGPNSAVRAALKRHPHVPGFGHPLYPQGEPRAQALLSSLRRVTGGPALAAVDQLAAIMESEAGERPTVDLALAALMRALGRPPEDALTLFALSRTTGWLAHALEARALGETIRPRARYVEG